MADTAPATPVLANFDYAIRGPHHMAHLARIDAQVMPDAVRTTASTFEAAVAQARAAAATPVDDTMHRIAINPAQAVLQARDGTYAVAPLVGLHRERVGPLFVDGDFFDRTALSLQVARTVPELLAVVGSRQVLDLRRDGAAFALPNRPGDVQRG